MQEYNMGHICPNDLGNIRKSLSLPKYFGINV